MCAFACKLKLKVRIGSFDGFRIDFEGFDVEDGIGRRTGFERGEFFATDLGAS